MPKPSVFVGDRFKTTRCGYATVIEYKSIKNVTVEFEDGTRRKCAADKLKLGYVHNPNMSRSSISIGEKFKTNNYGYVTIVKYKNKNNVLVKFKDGTVIKCSTANLLYGRIRNPNFPSLCGIGYIGQGIYGHGKHKKLYALWKNMLRRCYDIEFQKNHPTYIGCTVAKRWHNFQNFCEDVMQMVGYDKLAEGWQLDKDIIYRDNCNYSRKTCCLVPQYINSIIVANGASRGKYPIGVRKTKRRNRYRADCQIKCKQITLGYYPTIKEAFLAYKEAKEKEIKRVAKLYKNEIDPRAYDALMKYEVRIDD